MASVTPTACTPSCVQRCDNKARCSALGACMLTPVESKPLPAPDVVNHPSHYTTGKIEVLDFIEDQKFGYLDGQIIKYVSRYRHKNGLEDLKKAEFYLKRLIKAAESK